MADRKKRAPGRPPFYETAEQMQAKVDEYFALCKPVYDTDDEGNIRRDKWGNATILAKNPPTYTGLCLHLGFSTRQALDNYQAKDQIVDVITRAKLRVQNYAESTLYDERVRPQGPMFILQNMGWKQKQEIEHSGSVTILDDIGNETK